MIEDVVMEIPPSLNEPSSSNLCGSSASVHPTPKKRPNQNKTQSTRELYEEKTDRLVEVLSSIDDTLKKMYELQLKKYNESQPQ